MQENRNTQNQNKLWMILGMLAIAAGVAVVVIGIRQSIVDMRVYAVMQAIGAALVILGITPIAFYFINYSQYHDGESWTERMNKKLQKRMDELEEQMGQESDGDDQGWFSSLFGMRGDAQNPNESSCTVQNQPPQGFVPPQGWILAEVVGITRNLRGSQHEQVEYYVICRYFDGVTHTFQTFTSKAVKEYPGKGIIGKKVRVTFHSKDPNDYTIDLNSAE